MSEHPFTTHHRMLTESGTLGELTLPAFSKGDVFRATDVRELTVERTSWWRGWHELWENEIVLGTARPLGFWQRSMNVGYKGLLLIDARGTVLLEIQPRGIFRRGAYLRILGPVHADLSLFAYYLVSVRWQEQAAAAAGS